MRILWNALGILPCTAGQVSSSVKDGAAAKDLAAYAKQLEALDATPQQVLTGNSPILSCELKCQNSCCFSCVSS